MPLNPFRPTAGLFASPVIQPADVRPSPAARRSGLAALLLPAAVAVLLATAPAPAQSDAGTGGDRQAEGMILSHQFLGAARRDGTVVRAGAGEGEFAVAALDKGRQVVVVGISGQWLRILPPEQAFCLVPKADVNLRGEADGERIGRVTDKCSVRVGSTLSQGVDAVAARLSPGDEVQVVGEDSQYYHVTPPKSVFFYVAQKDLEQVREVKVTPTARGWKVGELPAAQAPAAQAPAEPEPSPATPPAPAITRTPAQPADEPVPPTVLPPGDDDGAAAADDTADATTPDAAPEVPAEAAPSAEAPATRPALVEAFRALDARYVDEAAKPLEEQPLADLRSQYADMLARTADDPAGPAVKPLIEARLKTIEIRQAALDDLRSIQSMREQMVKRQQALQAEQGELATRAQRGNVTMYAAVGQLQPSSLQIGGGSLYRLCDPQTGRTLVYLRADGQAAAALGKSLEKFVGVTGETVNDADLELKYVRVAKVADVDPSQLFETVAAEMIPPSLVQKAAAVN